MENKMYKVHVLQKESRATASDYYLYVSAPCKRKALQEVKLWFVGVDLSNYTFFTEEY